MKLNELLLPFDKIYPVGSYYETSNADFNPNTEWSGTWIREDDGTTLVSYKSSGKFNQPIGTIVGEETHQLTTDEMANHDHVGISWLGDFQNQAITLNDGSSPGYHLSFGGNVEETQKNNIQTNKTGGNQPHNNVQPSTIVYRWHRTS